MKKLFLFFGFAVVGVLAGSISAIAQVDGNQKTVNNKEPIKTSRNQEVKTAQKLSSESEGRKLEQTTVAPAAVASPNKQTQAPATPQPASRQKPVSTSAKSNDTPAAAKSSK